MEWETLNRLGYIFTAGHEGMLSFYFVHSKVKNGKLYLATFAAILGPLSFGFVLGYSSPAIPDLCRIPDPRMRLDPEEASWFGVRWSTMP